MSACERGWNDGDCADAQADSPGLWCGPCLLDAYLEVTRERDVLGDEIADFIDALAETRVPGDHDAALTVALGDVARIVRRRFGAATDKGAATDG